MRNLRFTQQNSTRDWQNIKFEDFFKKWYWTFSIKFTFDWRTLMTVLQSTSFIVRWEPIKWLWIRNPQNIDLFPVPIYFKYSFYFMWSQLNKMDNDIDIALVLNILISYRCITSSYFFNERYGFTKHPVFHDIVWITILQMKL